MSQPLSDDDIFFAERGFGLTMGFGQRPALVVVDVIRGFTDPAMPLGSDLDDVVVQVNRLLEACRPRGIPVFFMTVSYDEPNLEDAGVWALKQKGAQTLRTGSDAVKLDPRLRAEPGDPVLVKKYASSFFGTDLLSRLVSRGVDTLLITGCTTSGCVRATAVDAVQNGLRPMVVREAVGDRSQAAHEQSLFDLQAKYADVVEVETVLEYLRRR
ncbi:MAG: isochorismatase family protein [Pigmentiphaga sp.]|nr:isochorismatase family protein [Pigmentiphaga sp.]